MTFQDHIVEAWCHALHTYYSLARGERLGELTGRRPRLLDGRGLHPLSLEVGRIFALQDLMPLLETLEFNHNEIRNAAHKDAAEQYELETAVDIGMRYGWLSHNQAEAVRLSLTRETSEHAERTRSRE